jgi:aspartate racemase
MAVFAEPRGTTPGTIGLLGGMSWTSTALYYRHLNEMVAGELGGQHSARVLLSSIDFQDLVDLQEADDWDGAAALLVRSARSLDAAGAGLLLICANTMHIAADQVAASVSTPLLHVVDVVAAEAHRLGIDTVGLLGTAYTMGLPFYRERLESHGLRVLLPDAEQRAELHEIIYSELTRNVFTDAARSSVNAMANHLAARGCGGVILGCTELELLGERLDAPVETLATTRLHARAAVDWSLAP